jgi:glycosyltransferase involved in cell wall biosynthesis
VSDPLSIAAIEDGSACGYYRLRLPFEQLAANGHDICIGTDGAKIEDRFPIIVAQRMGQPGFEETWLNMWRRHKMVWETDDDLWTVDPTNTRAAEVFTPELLASIEVCASTAHMVTVSTEPLAEVMRRFNPNVVVLPNHIDGALLDIERPRRDRLTIGWAGGDSHLKDWWHVAPHLRRFLRQNPAVQFHNIGHDFRIAAKLDLEQTYFTPWSNDLFTYYRSIDFDIGLAPLLPTRFNRSKSHIKALEYAALGIPVIASDVAPYRDFVLDGVTGFLVRHDHEWGRRLRELVNDEDMRTEMGAKAKEHARTYVIQDGWRLWEDAYRRLT